VADPLPLPALSNPSPSALAFHAISADLGWARAWCVPQGLAAAGVHRNGLAAPCPWQRWQ
jgi:hypothetical protein